MTIKTITHSPHPSVARHPSEVQVGVFYDTADGRLIYAYTRSVLLVLNDPKCRIIPLSQDNPSSWVMSHFPLIRAAEGTEVTFAQAAPGDLVTDTVQETRHSDGTERKPLTSPNFRNPE